MLAFILQEPWLFKDLMEIQPSVFALPCCGLKFILRGKVF